MSDERTRDLERRARHDPGAAELLVRARCRAGDGPYLPVLASDALRWWRALRFVRLHINLLALRGAISASIEASFSAAMDAHTQFAGVGFPWIDPAAEARATEVLLSSGITSFAQERARHYGDEARILMLDREAVRRTFTARWPMRFEHAGGGGNYASSRHIGFRVDPA